MFQRSLVYKWVMFHREFDTCYITNYHITWYPPCFILFKLWSSPNRPHPKSASMLSSMLRSLREVSDFLKLPPGPVEAHDQVRSKLHAWRPGAPARGALGECFMVLKGMVMLRGFQQETWGYIGRRDIITIYSRPAEFDRCLWFVPAVFWEGNHLWLHQCP